MRDCIDDVCTRLDIADQVEIEEYTLFLRTRDGQFSRLRSEEYILDVTAELLRNRRDYDLVFQRTVWYFPFRTSDNLLYNELMYFQVRYNYYVAAFPSITKFLLVSILGLYSGGASSAAKQQFQTCNLCIV